MRAERPLLRLGEYLVSRASQRLPRDIREERYREWAAELPAILNDPQIGFAPHRAARMLAYAADALRGAATTSARTRLRASGDTGVLVLLLVACLAVVAEGIWTTVREPGHGVNYAQLAWSLLLAAYPLSRLVRPAGRRAVPIFICATLAGVAVQLWHAAQTPADWANYFGATLLGVGLLAWWLVSRRQRLRRRNGARAAR